MGKLKPEKLCHGGARSEDPSETTDKEIVIPSDVEPKTTRNGRKDNAKTLHNGGKANEPTSDLGRLQRN